MPIVIRSFVTIPLKLIKGLESLEIRGRVSLFLGGNGNQRKNRDHLDYCIITIFQEVEVCPYE